MSDPLQDQPINVLVPWQTRVGAKRLARQRGLTLDAYIEGLINADLKIEAAKIRRFLAQEEAELRVERDAAGGES